MSISGIPRYFPLTLLCVYHVIFSLSRILGNLILNWPKLLRPLKTVFFTLYRCVCVRNVILHHFRYKEVRFEFF